MIYVTGDTHGIHDVYKIWGFKMEETDYLIICGDFGFIWDGGVREEIYLNRLDSLEGTVLFVDGNHENFPLIYSYPVEEWNGGLVHKIRPSVLHLMRGQIYTIENKKIFVMGGGTSIDKMWRTEGISWWAEEMPSKEEYEIALDNLEKAEWKVDYVCTHAAPAVTHDVVLSSSYYKPQDELTKFLQTVDDRLSYKQWFFGHYHDDRQIDVKHRLLYQDIIPIEGETNELPAE